MEEELTFYESFDEDCMDTELLQVSSYLDPSNDHDTLCNAWYRLLEDRAINKHENE